MSFDKHRDYGIVSGGTTNARYYQDKKFYDNHYREVTEEGELINSTDDSEEELVPDLIEDEENLETLPWQTIKSRVLAAGGEWVNKIEGIAYLQGV